ncbi:RNA 3'-terminal phosphate cyclase [Candidatus Woesearchaeota archaeon]|nr:RNA 3'-terminal phosphate cyclase [Candidatus Woesearchaeota archaeon]
MIEIDGTYGEGGGQIVRTALALSALTGKPFHITKIREGRKVPGLKQQHVKGIEAITKLCNATSTGAHLGSKELQFAPATIKAQTLSVDIETAGSITLLLQSLLLPCIFSEGKFRLRLRGGTDVPWSLPIDYLSEVVLPQLRRYAAIECKTEARGYYPKGGGKVDIKIKGNFSKDHLESAPALMLASPGKLIHIKGLSHASSDLKAANVAERQAHAAKYILAKLGCPVTIATEYQHTPSTGSGITLWAIFSHNTEDVDPNNPFRIGADSHGERGKRAEIVGEEAANKLLAEISAGAAVDQHLCDNLIPLLGLVGGSLKTSVITRHTRSNIYVTELFLNKKFVVDEENKIISCKNNNF